MHQPYQFAIKSVLYSKNPMKLILSKKMFTNIKKYKLLARNLMCIRQLFRLNDLNDLNT